jgi:hypothetical protein
MVDMDEVSSGKRISAEMQAGEGGVTATQPGPLAKRAAWRQRAGRIEMSEVALELSAAK